jgi:hypothetical protein
VWPFAITVFVAVFVPQLLAVQFNGKLLLSTDSAELLEIKLVVSAEAIAGSTTPNVELASSSNELSKDPSLFIRTP